jgi:hypothetical protein
MSGDLRLNTNVENDSPSIEKFKPGLFLSSSGDLEGIETYLPKELFIICELYIWKSLNLVLENVGLSYL